MFYLAELCCCWCRCEWGATRVQNWSHTSTPPACERLFFQILLQPLDGFYHDHYLGSDSVFLELMGKSFAFMSARNAKKTPVPLGD